MNSKALLRSNDRIPSTFLALKKVAAHDWLLVGTLLVLVLVSRLPFQTSILYHWDSVNFANAIALFDLAREQPHPPGYIGYVWLSRLVNIWFQDAAHTLVVISMVSGVLASIALFYLGQAMFNRKTGLIAALLLATSPLFWFYNEIALPHSLDTLLIVVSMWWLYKTMRGHYVYIYAAVTVLALAGAMRPQTLVFLAPVTMFALRGVGWRRFLTAGILGGLLCLLWFVPLMVLSGGITSYLALMSAFTHRFQDSTSIFAGAGWSGLRRNLTKLAIYTLYGWSVALLPAMIYGVRRIIQHRWPKNWDNSLFLLLWIGPSLFFYIFIHMGQQGLVFVFLPALFLVSTVSLIRLFSTRDRWLTIATATLIAINIAIFLFLPEYPLGANTQRLLTRSTLANSDSYFTSRFEVIEKDFRPESTLILAANSHHLEYYLPHYKIISILSTPKWENTTNSLTSFKTGTILSMEQLGLQPDQDNNATVIIFDPAIEQFNETEEFVEVLPLPNGTRLPYMQLAPSGQIYFNESGFGLLP